MGKISLEGLLFFAYHGFYEEERKTGNKYLVDISVSAPVKEAAENDEITGTVNYEQLYKIVKKEMEKPSRLLENIAHRIIRKVLEEIAAVEEVWVRISKHNPPIGGICDKATVSLSKKR